MEHKQNPQAEGSSQCDYSAGLEFLWSYHSAGLEFLWSYIVLFLRYIVLFLVQVGIGSLHPASESGAVHLGNLITRRL